MCAACDVYADAKKVISNIAVTSARVGDGVLSS